MNRFITVIIILSGIVFFSGCEKDDICVEGDTPQLVIRFYDVENPTEFKAVPGLRIAGADKDVTVSTFADRSDLDSIAIPLNPGANISEFLFIINSADTEDGFEAGNIDGINFSYEIQEQYIGRACGYIANFDNLNATTTTDTENWIQNVEITKTLVIREDTLSAHVKIFH